MKTPLYVQFAPLVPLTLPQGSNVPVPLDISLAEHCQHFSQAPAQYVSWFELPCLDQDLISVLPGILYAGHGFVFSDQQPVTLLEFLEDVAPLQGPAPKEPKADEEDKPPRAPKSAREKALALKHPSLFAAAPAKKTFYKDGEPVEVGDSGAREIDVMKPLPKDLSDEELDVLFSQLEQKRIEWSKMGIGSEGADFSIRMLKGLWTFQHKGVCFDAAQGRALGGEALKWCERYQCQTSMRFSTIDCGEHDAIVLAQSWCHKMQYLFDLWMSSADANFEYTQAHLDNWEVPEALKKLGLGKKWKGRTRAQDIVQIFPKL